MLALLTATSFARADEDDQQPGNFNLATKTAGGLQFWADVQFFHQWRIQENAWTGHCRLLDGDNRRHAWGTREECQQALEQIRRDRALLPMRGRAVLVIHGLTRTCHAMEPLAEHLRIQGDYEVFNVAYPSTRMEIAKLAANLASILEHLEGIEEINFACHSMGNIVVRHYLADQTDPATGKTPDPRIRRMVMLGPPNHGAEVAEALAHSTLFGVVFGKPGQQLGRLWEELEPHLATPRFEFGIIAGGKSDGEGYNPVLPGDDDGLVTVESARLQGAADLLVVPVLHTYLMADEEVQAATLRFLQQGYFVSPEARTPVQ